MPPLARRTPGPSKSPPPGHGQKGHQEAHEPQDTGSLGLADVQSDQPDLDQHQGEQGQPDEEGVATRSGDYAEILLLGEEEYAQDFKDRK